VGDDGLGFGAVFVEAAGEGGEGVIGAAGELGAAAGHGSDWLATWRPRRKTRPHEVQTSDGGRGPRMTGSSTRMRMARSTERDCSRSMVSKAVAWPMERGSRRGPMSRGAWRAIGGRPRWNLIGPGGRARSTSRRGDRRGCGGFLLTQHGADGGGQEAEALPEEFRLSPLPRGGRSEQHEAMMHEAGAYRKWER